MLYWGKISIPASFQWVFLYCRDWKTKIHHIQSLWHLWVLHKMSSSNRDARSQEVGVSCRHLLLAYTLFCWWTYLRCGVRDVRRKLHWRRQLVSGGQCSSASFPGAVRVPLAVTFFNPWSRMAMMNFYNSVVSSVIPASLPS